MTYNRRLRVVVNLPVKDYVSIQTINSAIWKIHPISESSNLQLNLQEYKFRTNSPTTGFKFTNWTISFLK